MRHFRVYNQFINRSVRREILLAVILSALIPATIIAIYAVSRTEKVLTELKSAQELRLVESRAVDMDRFLTTVRSDLLFLSQAPEIRRFVNLRAADANFDDDSVLSNIENLVFAFLDRQTSNYLRACLLDVEGMEQLCVHQTPDGAAVTPANVLASQANQRYFDMVFRNYESRQQSVYIEDYRLAHEHSDYGVEEAASHYVSLLQDDSGMMAGLLVIEVKLDPIVNILTDDIGNSSVRLLDFRGMPIFDSTINTIAGDLPESSEPRVNFSREYPNDAALILGKPSGVLVGSPDRRDLLTTFATVNFPGDDDRAWTVIYSQPLSNFLNPVVESQLVIVLITAVSLIVVLFLAMIVVRNFTRPITHLASAADAINREQWDVAIPEINRVDELGDLAQAFANMIARLHGLFDEQNSRINELQQAHSSLQQSEARFSAAFNNSPLAVSVLRVNDSQFLDVNDQFCQIAGYDRDFILAHTTKELNLWVDGTQQETIYERVLQERVVRSADVLMRRPDGENRSLLSSFSLIEVDGEPCIFGVGVDISERKLMEDQLRQQNQALETLNQIATTLSESPDLEFEQVLIEVADLIPYDRAGIALQQQEILFIAAAQEHTALGVQANPNAVVVDAHVQEVFEKRETRIYPGNANDDRKTQSWMGIPLLYLDDCFGVLIFEKDEANFYGSLHMQKGLTFARQLSAAIENVQLFERVLEYSLELEDRVSERTTELEEANFKLRQIDSMKTRFISDVAHELRTPISVLNTRMYLLEKSQGKDGLGKHIQILKTHLNHLIQLTENVLDLSRLDLMRKEVQYQSVDLNVVAARIVDAYQPIAVDAGLILDVDFASNLPLIVGQPNQLTQVITNLITNAIRYTPSGGIKVCTNYDRELETVCFSLTDTGLGIEENELPFIFDRFFRSRKVVQSAIPGTGLGLAIVREIVELHGGHINVSSTPQQGTTFTIEFPAHI